MFKISVVLVSTGSIKKNEIYPFHGSKNVLFYKIMIMSSLLTNDKKWIGKYEV